MRLFLLPLFAILLQPTAGFAFEDPRTHGTEAREFGEDPSCEVVNLAYVRTVNSSRYSVDYYELENDGNEVLRSQGRFVGRSYHRRFESLFWTERRRPLLATVTMDGPVAD